MLRWRLTLGTLFVAILAGLCWLDFQTDLPGLWLAPLALLVTGLGADEVVQLAAARRLPVRRWTAVFGAVLVVIGAYVPAMLPGVGQTSHAPFSWPLAALALGLIVAVLVEMFYYEKPGEVIARLAISAFAMLYVGMLMSFVIGLRIAEPVMGMAALVSLIAVVKLCDIGAYTVGRLVGRHKMAPTLSPGKTWEGAGGGIFFACAGAFVVFRFWTPSLQPVSGVAPVPFWGWIAFGVAVGIAGMIGDLAESLLKRDAGRKDSSTWMPGFGGVLDLLDSILMAAPVASLFWGLHLVG